MKNNSPYEEGYGLKYPDSRMVSAIIREKINSRFGIVNSLDIGCGIGNTMKFCEDLGFNAFGLDLDSSAIRHSILKSNKNLFHHNLINQMPSIYDRFFQVITDRASLQHNTAFDIENYILPNVCQVISPEGILFSLWAGQGVDQGLITKRFKEFTPFEIAVESLNKFFRSLDTIKFESVSLTNGQSNTEYLYIAIPR
jgi:SAM-dependent methyltransferase